FRLVFAARDRAVSRPTSPHKWGMNDLTRSHSGWRGTDSTMSRPRLRDLGITIGQLPPGPLNAVTDVPGLRVGHCTLIDDTPRVPRTGVTMVVPRDGAIWDDHAFAGFYSFNGNGEMTGLPWLEESGLLVSPVGITNTHAVGVVRDALVAYAVEKGLMRGF